MLQELPLSQNVYSSRYYEQLSQHVAQSSQTYKVFCFELMMVHLAVVPFFLVLDHGTELSRAVRGVSE